MPSSLESNLDEKTESATPFRREEFRRQGIVALSREALSFSILLGFGLSCLLFSHLIKERIFSLFHRGLHLSSRQDLDASSLFLMMKESLWSCGQIASPILISVFILAALFSVVQVGFHVTFEPLAFNWERINPVMGFSRLFSSKGAVEALKAFLKLILVLYILYLFLKREFLHMPDIFTMSLKESTALAWKASGQAFFVIVGAFSVVAGADYYYQRFHLERQMRMSRAEAKEEFKLREGDPLIKSRIRSVQRKMASQRMMEEVPKSDVVVTNPTHLAVALRYELKSMHAPKVVAKGAGVVAEKIKELARLYHIPILENKPLARTLFREIDVGGFIPRELYKAVAQVLSYVYRLKNKTL